MQIYYYECIANDKSIGRTSPFPLHYYQNSDLNEEIKNIVDKWCKIHPEQSRPSYYYLLRQVN